MKAAGWIGLAFGFLFLIVIISILLVALLPSRKTSTTIENKKTHFTPFVSDRIEDKKTARAQVKERVESVTPVKKKGCGCGRS
jgi:hypothetical protein